MWPCEYISRHFFEIKDDIVPLLPLEKIGIVCIGIDLSEKGDAASPQSEAVALKAMTYFKIFRDNVIGIFTAGYRVKGGLYTEAEAMERYITGSFPDIETFKVEDVDGTHLEVQRVIEILQEQKCKRAILIGQQLHLTRIRALFLKIGAGSGIQFFFVKARSRYGGGSQKRLWCFPFFLFWEKAICFPYLKWKGVL